MLIFSFLVFVVPTLQQATQPQCQCVPVNGATECLKYDSRFQAATLEEAMSSFPDLSFKEKPLTAATTLQEKATCTTQKCIDCKNDIQHRLKEVGLLPVAVNEVFISQPNLTSTCDEYKFTNPNQNGVYLDKKEKKEKRSSSEEDEEEEEREKEREERKKRRERKESEEREDRKKRQIPTGTQPHPAVIGERFTLSCSAKGVTTDVSGLVSLCSYCWVWRKLPDNYSPQYINELVCDDTDNNCLSGYASCGVGHREIEVVRDDAGIKTTVVLTAGSYCECKVSLNSALTTLVAGGGLQTALPAVIPTNNTVV